MGLKAAVAEMEVMRLGKGTEWPGLAQGHCRYQIDLWGEPMEPDVGVQNEPFPASSKSRRQPGVPSTVRLLGMPTAVWEASPCALVEEKGWEEGEEGGQGLVMEFPSAGPRERLGLGSRPQELNRAFETSPAPELRRTHASHGSTPRSRGIPASACCSVG